MSFLLPFDWVPGCAVHSIYEPDLRAAGGLLARIYYACGKTLGVIVQGVSCSEIRRSYLGNSGEDLDSIPLCLVPLGPFPGLRVWQPVT